MSTWVARRFELLDPNGVWLASIEWETNGWMLYVDDKFVPDMNNEFGPFETEEAAKAAAVKIIQPGRADTEET